jgi:hypothetical protein
MDRISGRNHVRVIWQNVQVTNNSKLIFELTSAASHGIRAQYFIRDGHMHLQAAA